MNSIQRFDFNGATLRTLTDEEEEPWFVAKDVCDILELGNVSQTVNKLDEDEKSYINITINDVAQNGGRAPIIISEPGLYKLIMRSRKPEAKDFQRWVTHDVLPQIRKHGAYMTKQTLDKALTSPDFLIQLATRLKEEQEKVKRLEPKAKALDDFTNVEDGLLIRDAAKILSNAGTPIGEKQLRAWMAEHKWIYLHNGHWHANTEHVKAGHLKMTMPKSHGTRKDGTKFAFPPTVRVTRKGLALLHRNLGEITLDKALKEENQ